MLGAGALNGDMSGSMANMLGIPKKFVKEVYADVMGKSAFSLVPIIMRPKSRGRIRLKSTNPFQWPRMEANYLSHPDDIQTLVEGAKLVRIFFRKHLFGVHFLCGNTNVLISTHQSKLP